MKARRFATGLRLAVIFCIAGTVIAGCVVVPYPARTEHQALPVRLESADKVLLSIGPRILLEDTRKALEKRDRDLEIVDSLAFRNRAFPDGDWRLSSLLDPTRPVRQAALEADFLLVVGQVSVEEDYHGMMALSPYGAFGAGRSAAEASALMLIVDLQRGQVLDIVRTRAKGNTVGVGVVVALVFHATTESSARRAYIDSMVEAIRSVRPRGPVRLALMTAEPVESGANPISLIAE
jgi:hypothetical protein